MKSKNAMPSIVCFIIFAVLAAFTGIADPNDSTAAVIVSFFAVAAAINAAECIIHNIKRCKARKTSLRHYIQSLKHKSA
ncbi:MAG: hypothetical protein K2H90_01470 [Oscillospiraceae bacterium]|nr:hypothetical protein [Oscillospiraceae bacterium]